MPFTPKINWADGDKLPASDMNRIEQGIADANAPVTTTANGLMRSTDKVKLDNLKGVVLATRPTITITDPPDDENLQASFNAILDYIDDILGR